MATQLINDVELWYSDSGGDGDVILFHHGWTSCHDTWEAAIERLTGDYRIVTMDARGAGDSARVDEGYTVEQYTADVIAMVDSLGIDTFTYVGHSMGGGIGMMLGVEHGDRLDRLVLVAPIPSGGIQVPASVHDAAAELWHGRQEEEMLRQRIVGAARPETTDVEQTKAMLARTLSVSPGHYDGSWDAMCAFNVTARLADVDTPTLMVAGAADGLVQANVGDFLLLPNASLHVFNRVGHGVQNDVPDEFAQLIDDFMAQGVVTARTLLARIEADAQS